MSSQLEDHKDVSIKSWRRQSNVLTTTKSVTNDSTVTNAEAVKQQTQVVEKGGDDFWMPAINTKQKHSNTIKIMQNPNQTLQSNSSNNNNQLQHHTTTASSLEPQQCNDGTQLLKSLLGLSANQSQVIPGPAITAKVCFIYLNRLTR